MNRIILHIDMDAFFAAVEELEHPEYVGKPLVVGADPSYGRGVVSTCNYKAREFGIHSAMPISQAYKRCPQAIFVPPRLKRYAEISRQIMDILYRFSPDVEQLSIDEAFLDITSAHKICGTPEDCAKKIKQAIRDETHLTASIGIAPNKFIAKIASDMQKPDGLVIVQPTEIEQFLHPLDISRLWGVGKKTLPILQRMGIYKIGDITKYSLPQLEKKLGLAGNHLYHLAHGIDNRKIELEHVRKSISKEFTFDKDINDETEIRTTLKSICNELSHEMRRKNIKGRTITLKIRLTDFSTFTRSKTVQSPLHDFDSLYCIIENLYAQFERAQKVRLLGVAAANLEFSETQMDLFTQEAPKKDIDSVLDKVREKFGERAITRASLIDKNESARWIRD